MIYKINNDMNADQLIAMYGHKPIRVTNDELHESGIRMNIIPPGIQPLFGENGLAKVVLRQQPVSSEYTTNWQIVSNETVVNNYTYVTQGITEPVARQIANEEIDKLSIRITRYK